MRARFFTFLAAVVLLASCAKEALKETPEEYTGEKTVLTVRLPDDGKTYMGALDGVSRKIYWSNNDRIAVNGISSIALADLEDNTDKANFVIDGVVNTPYKVVYPYEISKGPEDLTHVTLPAIQTYKAGGFADGMFPMAGYTENSSDLSLNHLCAILQIKIKRETADHAEERSGTVDEDNIIAVRFKGKNSERVNGTFSIDYTKDPITLATETGSTSEQEEVRVVKSQATSTSTAIEYYLVVPARTYENGFDIIVQDVNGHIMTKSKASSWTGEAGKLYKMPEFEFVPTETELGVEIATAQDLIDFATAYNNKEYESQGSSLVATLTNNIVFDENSSAAFNATGGIGLKDGLFGGTENYYYDGVFNGNDGSSNHSISGLNATVPLFCATERTGQINDITIENNCTFTFTHPNNADYFYGSVVGYHKGKMKGVTSEANISLVAVSSIGYETAIGGLVGRETVGTIDNCTYSGAISIPSGFQSSAKIIYIGGLVGRISNADGEVKKSSFSGTIDNQGQLTVPSDDNNYKNNPHLLIGGIVGLNSGTVEGCTTYNQNPGITVILNDGSDHPYSGTIVTHSTIAYHYAIAGIAGRNDGTVTDCTNNAGVLNIFSAARGQNDLNGRYLEVGGIVGYNSSGKTISGCTNNGGIITRANPKMQYVGGIVAWNDGTVSSCKNSSTATIGMGTSHTSPYGARMIYVGGVIGHNRSSASVSNIQNNAAINVSRVESTGGVAHRIGGVIGQNDAAIDGTDGSGTISNSGNIAQSNGVGMCNTPTEKNEYGYFLGGVVGYSTKAVKNVSNSGNVTYTCTATGVGAQYVHLGGVIGKVLAASTVDVEKCSNTANVTFTASATHKANANTRYYYNYLGGIVGYAKNAAIKGDSSTKCTNSGIIKGGDSGDNNNQATPSFTIGGIVGYLTGGSSIDYCELSGTGQAYNDHWSNRGIASYDCPIDGGIAGLVDGADTAPIPVSNCTVTSTKGDNAIFARRGAVGGIVGMAKYATISDCTVPVPFSGSGYFYGGIVAAAQNSTISNCTYSGTTIKSTQMQIGGGIIGQLDTATKIDGCSSYATTVNKNGTAVTTTGGIAGKSVAGSTIANCHYTASIAKICGDSNFTNGGGNAADL